MLNLPPLSEPYNTTVHHLKTEWNDVMQTHEKYSAERMVSYIQKIENYISSSINGHKKARKSLQRILSLLCAFKNNLEAYNWKPPTGSPDSLTCFYSDATFYMGICCILQKVTKIWASVLPPKMVPANHMTRVNLSMEVIKKVKNNIPDEFEHIIPETDNFFDPLEDTLNAISLEALKYKGYTCISELVAKLNTNKKEYLPQNKAEEEQIIATLKEMKLNLQSQPSSMVSFSIIIEAVKTGWLLPHNIENSLTKIFAECKKYDNPAFILNKYEAVIQEKINLHRITSRDNNSLQKNAFATLLHLKTLIEQEKQKTGDMQPVIEIHWHSSRQKFIEIIAPLIKEKTIQLKDKKDYEPVINLISHTFKIRKERGEGYLAADSIKSYLKEAISEYV
jgi:hypothetical protein